MAFGVVETTETQRHVVSVCVVFSFCCKHNTARHVLQSLEVCETYDRCMMLGVHLPNDGNIHTCAKSDARHSAARHWLVA